MDNIMASDDLEKTILPQKRGRMTIPVEFRRKLGIDENTPLHLRLFENTIEIKLAPSPEENGLLREYSQKEVREFLEKDTLKEGEFEKNLKTIRIWPKPSPILRVFLDGSVLIAALHAQPTYSRLVMELCRQEKVQALLLRTVIREAEQAVRKWMDEEGLPKFYALLSEMAAEIIPLPRKEVMDIAEGVAEEEHSHVLSSAWAAGANFILSLDQNSFLVANQRQAALPAKVRTPHEFIEEEIPV